MKVKGVVDEDFVNYAKPSMFVSFPICSFKCDRENGCQCCQNMPLASMPDIDVDPKALVRRYLDNDITHAIVFGGLDPMDSFKDLLDVIHILRVDFGCDDDVVIYTGYDKQEVGAYLKALSEYGNIIIKYGRFRPHQPRHLDPVLGVELASDNQYAERLS